MCNIMGVTRLNRSQQDVLLIVGISQIVLASYADALRARHAIFLPHERALRASAQEAKIVLVRGREGENDQPKIERLVNNDARLILRGKLNGATTRQSRTRRPRRAGIGLQEHQWSLVTVVSAVQCSFLRVPKKNRHKIASTIKRDFGSLLQLYVDFPLTWSIKAKRRNCTCMRSQ